MAAITICIDFGAPQNKVWHCFHYFSIYFTLRAALLQYILLKIKFSSILIITARVKGQWWLILWGKALFNIFGRMMLKFQYFSHLMWRADTLEKTLMLGKIEGRRRRDRGWDGWMASPPQWTWVWASSGRWWRTGKPGVLESMGFQRGRHDWATEQQHYISLVTFLPKSYYI